MGMLCATILMNLTHHPIDHLAPKYFGKAILWKRSQAQNIYIYTSWLHIWGSETGMTTIMLKARQALIWKRTDGDWGGHKGYLGYWQFSFLNGCWVQGFSVYDNSLSYIHLWSTHFFVMYTQNDQVTLKKKNLSNTSETWQRRNTDGSHLENSILQLSWSLHHGSLTLQHHDRPLQFFRPWLDLDHLPLNLRGWDCHHHSFQASPVILMSSHSCKSLILGVKNSILHTM